MIPFFRKIRKKMADDNRPLKYMRYAIGEIILVVIGILIALSINNWNANQIEQKKEATYLSNIKRDLNEQLSIINEQVAYEKSINDVATPIIQYYKTYNSFKIDSAFTESVGFLAGRKTFVTNNPTYTELISSGNIDIISDNILKDNIIKYYQELERNELIINKNNNLFTDAVFIPEVLGLSELQFKGKSSLDLLKVFEGSDATLSFIDLNEKRLKEITKSQLNNPENELRFINNINFRNFIAIVHTNRLNEQKNKTLKLIDDI